MEIPISRDYFQASINLGGEMKEVYRINNYVRVQINAMFPSTPWSRSFMIISVEKFLNNTWQTCNATKDAVFNDCGGSLNEDLQPSNPPVALYISKDKNMLILHSNAPGYQTYFLRFQMNIPKTHHGFTKNSEARFRLAFSLYEEIFPFDHQDKLVVLLQTKYSNIFDVISRGSNSEYMARNLSVTDFLTYQYVQRQTSSPDQQLLTEYGFFHNGQQFFDNLTLNDVYAILRGTRDFARQDDSVNDKITNEHNPVDIPNNIPSNATSDEIVRRMTELVLEEKKIQSKSSVEPDKTAKSLQDGLKFVVRRRDPNRTTEQPNNTVEIATDDIPNTLPVLIITSGETVEIILRNNLDSSCGFTVCCVVNIPGMGSLPFESNTKIDKNGIFYIIPYNSFIYSSLVAANTEGSEEDIATFTLVVKVMMESDKSEKYYVLKRRCVILSSDQEQE
jgi:hypothetical protein